MSDIAPRVAGAPISWGVSEVPGWGYQMAPDRVLSEMGEVGLSATEFGPTGFLPDDPHEKADLLAGYGLVAVGGFLPVVLHDPDLDPLPAVARFVDDCLATGASVMVLAAHTGTAGYDDRRALDERGWQTLLSNLDRSGAYARDRGVVTALHPHLGTMVERAGEVDRVMADSTIGVCVDTGHLLAGGTDPVRLTREHADRVVHVHLKDVDDQMSQMIRDGRMDYAEAVDRGVYRPLGGGDVDVAALVSTLECAGYTGWYVLEQDIKLHGEPEGTGPMRQVRESLTYLLEVAR